MVAAKGAIRPSGIEGWIGGRPTAVQTVRALLNAPAGSRIVDLERSMGDSNQVVRTLNELQNAGLVRIQVEHKTHELVARVPENGREALLKLLGRVGQ